MPVPNAPASGPPGIAGTAALAAPGARYAGFRLSSAFQPIYSLPHGRLVGHEALLRASSIDDDRPVSPFEVFAGCSDEQQLHDCDQLCRLVHLESFAELSRQRPAVAATEWLFVNVHPLAFQRLGQQGGTAQLRELLRHYAVGHGRLVFEVLEAEAADPAQLAASIAIAREAGLLIAIDDFGAGHSNFDRVWRMRPDIVKVDRTLVARAACDTSARRILRQMVALLHECGAQVLIEGVESAAEALVAIDCDAELVQGYRFGRPEPLLRPPLDAPPALLRLPAELADLRDQRRGHHGDRTLHFRRAMSVLARRLSGCDSGKGSATHIDRERFIEHAHNFLGLPGAESCRLLDGEGRQLGPRLLARPAEPLANPMAEEPGSCWSLRPHFAAALEHPGQVQVSRPYRSLCADYLHVTAAVAFHVQVAGQATLRVACGDFRWEE